MNLAEEVASLSLIDLAQANRDVNCRIRDIRNERDVRRNMYSDHEITETEHSTWVEGLSASQTQRFFAVSRRSEIIGGAGFNAISRTHKRADWAYYLSSSAQGRGLGSALEFRMIDFAFSELGLEKLNCEVIAWNTAVIKLHKRFGFVEEGLRRAHVWREGTDHDVIMLGITRNEWLQARLLLTNGAFRGL